MTKFSKFAIVALEEKMSKNDKPKPKFKQDIEERLALKLDTLEGYEEKSFEVDMRDFYQFMQGCQSVWTFLPTDEKYFSTGFQKVRFFTCPGKLDAIVTYNIKKQNMNIEDIPLIPFVEYKLVPTGNIEYYDATLTRDQRRNRRYWRGEAGRRKLHQQNKAICAEYHRKQEEKKRAQEEKKKAKE